jgi:hypothetical protein
VSRHCTPDCTTPSPSQAHCASGCHRTFGSVRAFDQHHDDGACLNPADLGMEPNPRGIWRHPMTDEAIARLQALRADTEAAIPATRSSERAPDDAYCERCEQPIRDGEGFIPPLEGVGLYEHVHCPEAA